MEANNMAAMREALERVLCWLKRMNAEPLNTLAVSELTPSYAVNRTAKSIIEDNDYHISQLTAALAAPARNCDVGTAEEQAERYVRYCDEFTRDGMHCETCPCCGKIPFGKCEFAWAQMPYKEQEGGAK